MTQHEGSLFEAVQLAEWRSRLTAAVLKDKEIKDKE